MLLKKKNILTHIDKMKSKSERLNNMETCPICGQKMEVKTSFKGRKMYRNKRKTYICKCGYSTIEETLREQGIRKGYCEN